MVKHFRILKSSLVFLYQPVSLRSGSGVHNDIGTGKNRYKKESRHYQRNMLKGM